MGAVAAVALCCVLIPVALGAYAAARALLIRAREKRAGLLPPPDPEERP